MVVDHAVIDIDMIQDLSIFRFAINPVEIFVTDQFARKVREHKLEGFDFVKLWPLPPHVLWHTPWKFLECQDELTLQQPVDERPIKGNTVVIRLVHNKASLTTNESAILDSYLDELDAILVSKTKRHKYFGSVEGHESLPNEIRLFLSCPDAVALAKKIKPWFKKIAWPAEKYLVMRFGEYVDINATEEYVRV